MKKQNTGTQNISRRTTIKWMASSAVVGMGGRALLTAGERQAASSNDWSQTHDRVWLSGDVWANPMEDWCVRDGAAECLGTGLGRSVHSLTHQISGNKPFRMEVMVKRVDQHSNDAGAGFRIGLQSEIDDHRANCFVVEGLRAGWMPGKLVLGSASIGVATKAKSLHLALEGKPKDANTCTLTLVAVDGDTGKPLPSITHDVPAGDILGNVSLAHNLEPLSARDVRWSTKKAPGSRYSFNGWSMSGEAFSVSPEQRFGPILWAMYSLSDSRSDEGFVLKLSALTGPMGEQDSNQCELLVDRGDGWKSLGNATLDPDAWVATFRIANWDASKTVPYKVVYKEKQKSGSSTDNEWTGSIRANPVGRPLRMGALTCQKDYGFPYAPVAENLVKLDPDLLFFSGDQIYEENGGFGIIRNPAPQAILNYLRKYYQFGWSFREAMRNAPTLCLPDDHDVFQGNLWGKGGMKMKSNDSSSGSGYIEPARMVNAVHKSTVAHHPDAYDPTPVEQGITTYYGDMVYGGVGFAIIADRQWKSGPDEVDTGGGRQDHVREKDFDTSALNKPGLIMLGERQEAFLKEWSSDWRGHSLKAVLSQTVFAGMATHHGDYNGYLKADLDCGGWPQASRDRAIELMRPSMALHINGDQHLGSLVQYGVEKQRDSNWSFCTPAISAGYPRWWRPDEVGMPHHNRPQHELPETGEYLDGLGNKVYVYAVENPAVGKAPNRYDQAHEKGSGFGFVTFDTVKKTYHIESFRFLIDAADNKPSNQFTGWPVTIQQQENRGENVLR